MAIQDLVNVSITTASSSPTLENFGTPMVVAYHTHDSGRVLEYSSLKSMVADGWTNPLHPAYLGASKVFAQNPRTKSVKIGRRANAPTHTFTLTVAAGPVAGNKYAVTVAGTKLTYTAGASPTTTTVATGLAALIDPLATVSATATAGVITVLTVAAGSPTRVQNWSDNLAYTDTSADPGLTADLNAILAADQNWFGFDLDTSGDDLESAAAWAEANRRMLVTQTSDSTAETDIGPFLAGLSYAFTALLFNGNDTQGHSGAAMMGGRFTSTPGSDTWAYKRLVGVSPDTLSASRRSALLASHITVYETVAGIQVTEGGQTASGEWADVTRFVAWLQSTIQTRLLALFANNAKVPYTNLGADMVAMVISGALSDGVKAGGLTDGTTSVETPDVDTLDASVRASRHLPNVLFRGRLQGAIHDLDVSGEITN